MHVQVHKVGLRHLTQANHHGAPSMLRGKAGTLCGHGANVKGAAAILSPSMPPTKRA